MSSSSLSFQVYKPGASCTWEAFTVTPEPQSAVGQKSCLVKDHKIFFWVWCSSLNIHRSSLVQTFSCSSQKSFPQDSINFMLDKSTLNLFIFFQSMNLSDYTQVHLHQRNKLCQKPRPYMFLLLTPMFWGLWLSDSLDIWDSKLPPVTASNSFTVSAFLRLCLFSKEASFI